MALSKRITLDNGQVITYHIITTAKVDFVNHLTRFKLTSFVDNMAYQRDVMNSIEAFNFTVSGVNVLLEDAYSEVMNFEKYAEAEIV